MKKVKETFLIVQEEETKEYMVIEKRFFKYWKQDEKEFGTFFTGKLKKVHEFVAEVPTNCWKLKEDDKSRAEILSEILEEWKNNKK